jgi:AraC-like DNA-binding protein
MVTTVGGSASSQDTWFFVGEDPQKTTYPLLVEIAGRSRWTRGASFSRKDCEFFCLELVTAGNLTFIQNGKDYLVEPGTLFIQRQRSNHQYTTGPAGFVHKRFIVLAGEILPTMIKTCGIEECDVCRISDTAAFARHAKECSRILAGKPTGYLDVLSVLAYRVLLLVKRGLLGPQYPPTLTCALGFVQHNLHRKISVEEIAAAAGVSSSHLYRLFEDHLQTSPIRHLTDIRIGQATEMLMRSTMPIKQIAFALGFHEPAYFTNQFRKKTGVSPREYRSGVRTVTAAGVAHR